MTFSKNPYYDGSNPYETEFELEIDSDEVFEAVKQEIKNGADEIPETVAIVIINDSPNFFIDREIVTDVNPYYYLTNEQIRELKNLIEKGEE